MLSFLPLFLPFFLPLLLLLFFLLPLPLLLLLHFCCHSRRESAALFSLHNCYPATTGSSHGAHAQLLHAMPTTGSGHGAHAQLPHAVARLLHAMPFCYAAHRRLMNARPATKLNNVQLLRAYAAVAVVYYHTGFHFGPVRPIGSFGVDLFFVISGYIMGRILDSEKTRQYFLRRRLLRIVPPYWFFTLLVFVASIFVPQMMLSTRGNIPELLKSLVFIPFMKESGVLRPTLFIGWSINYEMFFYVALAIGLAVVPRRAVWIGSGLILAILAACSFVPHPSPVVQFYSDPIIIEFVMGVLGFYVCKSVGTVSSTSLKSILLVLGIAAALALSVFQAFHLYLTHVRAISLGIAAWIAVCASVLLASSGWDTRNKFFILIGDASYILYLVHTFVLYFLDRALAHRLGPRLGHWLADTTVSGVLIGVTASVALSVLLHLYAERPLLRILTTRYGGHRPPAEFQPTTP